MVSFIRDTLSGSFGYLMDKDYNQHKCIVIYDAANVSDDEYLCILYPHWLTGGMREQYKDAQVIQIIAPKSDCVTDGKRYQVHVETRNADNSFISSTVITVYDGETIIPM